MFLPSPRCEVNPIWTCAQGVKSRKPEPTSACLETARPCCVASSDQESRFTWTVSTMAYLVSREEEEVSSRRGVTVQLRGGLVPAVAEQERRAEIVDGAWMGFVDVVEQERPEEGFVYSREGIEVGICSREVALDLGDDVDWWDVFFGFRRPIMMVGWPFAAARRLTCCGLVLWRRKEKTCLSVGILDNRLYNLRPRWYNFHNYTIT